MENRVHVFDPNGVDRPVENHPLAVVDLVQLLLLGQNISPYAYIYIYIHICIYTYNSGVPC